LLIVGVAASIKIALANVFLGIAGLGWLAALVRGSARRPHGAILVPIAAYAIVSVLSAVVSDDPRHSVTELADLLTLALVPMTVSLLDQKRWDRLLRLMAAVLVVSAIFGLMQFALSGDPLNHRMHGLATHYMTFSGWTLVVTLLLLGDVFFANDRRRLLWTLPAAALGVSTLLLGLTRGAWVGLTTGLLFALALGRPRALVLLPLAAALLFFVLPQPVLNRAASTIDFDEAATRERLQMLDSGLEMVRDHPVFGLGPGLVQPAFANYRSDGAPRKIPHLHNNAIQIAAERGTAGLLAYFAILAIFFVHLWRAIQTAAPASRPAIIGCLMAVAGVTAAGFFEYNWGDAEVWIVTLVSLSAPFALVPGGRRE
jgi:O-antigen ligase